MKHNFLKNSRHHYKQPQKPLDASSEYRETYRKFENHTRSTPIRQEASNQLNSGVPLDSTTSYEAEFKTHPVEARKRREQAIYIKPKDTFSGFTSYRDNFTTKNAEKRASARPIYQPSFSMNTPFSGSTAYKETFKQWELPRNKPFRQQSTIQLATGKYVDYQTTSRDDFTGHLEHVAEGRESAISKETTLSVGTGKISNETTSRRDYIPKEGGPEKSTKPPHYVLPHNDPFNHKTTNQQNFPWWSDGEKAQSFKPKPIVNKSDQPFESLTTHKLAYKPWAGFN